MLPWVRYGEARCRSREKNWKEMCNLLLTVPWAGHHLPHSKSWVRIGGDCERDPIGVVFKEGTDREAKSA